jgi:hypothetical protein
VVNGNYNATDSIQFSAGTNTGNPVNWTVSLHYQSSGGYPDPATDPTPLTPQGNTYSYSGYQSIDGQGKAIAQTSAGDGSAIQDRVAFYVEGPESGIPDKTITGQPNTLYQHSKSHPTDGTATPKLMTGVAERESSYHQFLYPNELVPIRIPICSTCLRIFK